MLLKCQWQIENLSLEISLCPGFTSTSSLNNSTNNRKLEHSHKCKTTKIL